MLVRQLDTSSDLGARDNGFRGLIAVQFFEKKRRKAWFMKGEEEVCWEQWTLDVTLATPRTESGAFIFIFSPCILPTTKGLVVSMERDIGGYPCVGK